MSNQPGYSGDIFSAVPGNYYNSITFDAYASQMRKPENVRRSLFTKLCDRYNGSSGP